ncbi:3-oxoacyl-ACP synthase [Fulvivirga sp. 29W222]|uniref:3-oxoacyl-ACP synthase n=1 Tax=Fulvivirga marina TaxID=2494733 RepID=A0A937KAS0_9BACT|nr:3-oxoacyl-ACP synthase [Fulvivirga marina]MBL6444962.1 3-oxoacyl-ACP synthase [Fulvivirga marina]
MNPGLKQKLYNKCIELIDLRIKNAKDAMDSAQESANNETKSSAGDKYETGREMMQQEMENNAIQLAEARKLKETISRIIPSKSYDSAQMGSLVITNNGSFYISIGLGKITVDGKDYFAIAPTSPLGSLLMDKTAQEGIELNGRKFVIEKVI